MKPFQGTFTQRYTAKNKLWGHLFQGRYKAKVVDDSNPSYFRKESEYIYLNPADAGLVEPGELRGYPWGSFPLYLKVPSKRPEWLSVGEVLSTCGIGRDSKKARGAYASYMEVKHRA